jgi:hypothetical protein
VCTRVHVRVSRGGLLIRALLLPSSAVLLSPWPIVCLRPLSASRALQVCNLGRFEAARSSGPVRRRTRAVAGRSTLFDLPCEAAADQILNPRHSGRSLGPLAGGQHPRFSLRTIAESAITRGHKVTFLKIHSNCDTNLITAVYTDSTVSTV